MKKLKYIDKLKSSNWQSFRINILIRDNYTCQNCNSFKGESIINISTSSIFKAFKSSLIDTNMIGLQVHHKCYTVNKEPWEYSSEYLVSLCASCHKKIHEESIIPIYDELGNILNNLEICDRCKGSGWLPEYNHVQDGICFKCYGEGVDLNKL